MGYFIILFTCSPISSLEASPCQAAKTCNGHCCLLTNNKDNPCQAVNFTSSGFARWAQHAWKGFAVVCDSLRSLFCCFLGAGDYNLPIAQLQNISGWSGRWWKTKIQQTEDSATATWIKRHTTIEELLQSHLQIASVIIQRFSGSIHYWRETPSFRWF